MSQRELGLADTGSLLPNTVAVCCAALSLAPGRLFTLSELFIKAESDAYMPHSPSLPAGKDKSALPRPCLPVPCCFFRLLLQTCLRLLVQCLS